MDTTTTPLSDQIAQTLAEEIIRGERAPGSRLGQDQIAQQFSCSHVPAREALQRLVAIELATSEPRRGVRVVSLSAEDHRDILDMRLALEPMAITLATAAITPQGLADLDLLNQACDAAQDAIAWERANRAFHLAILRPSGRPRMLRRIEDLQRLAAGHFHATWRKSWERTTDRDHEAILSAMARKDAQSAASILHAHLSRG